MTPVSLRNRRFRTLSAWATLWAMAAFLPLSAWGGTFTVNNTNDTGAGSLRNAVTQANANPGSTINFNSLSLPATIKLTSGELELTQNTTITGPGASVLTVSGDNQSRIFQVDGNATVTISGLTISNGNVTAVQALGGGVLNSGNLTIEDCTISNNMAKGLRGGSFSSTVTGGGVYSNGTALTVINSTISTNTASGFYGNSMGSARTSAEAAHGGGIYVDGGSGALLVTGSTITGNTAAGGAGHGTGYFARAHPGDGGDGHGGGIEIANSNSSLSYTIQNTLISNNTARGGGSGDGIAVSTGAGFGGSANGGGIAVYSGESTALPTVTLSSVSIENNLARGGEGTNTATLTANGAPSSSVSSGGNALGGGLYSSDVNVSLVNGTVTGNSAHGGSGGSCLGSHSSGSLSPCHGGTGGDGKAGGLEIIGSTLTVNGTTLMNNQTSAGAGGNGLNETSTSTNGNVTIKSFGGAGSAGFAAGGAIRMNGNSAFATVINTTISGNSATASAAGSLSTVTTTGNSTSLVQKPGTPGEVFGGGIDFSFGGNASLISYSTITGNQAVEPPALSFVPASPLGGGGYAVEPGGSQNVGVESTILANNTVVNLPPGTADGIDDNNSTTTTSLGYNIIGVVAPTGSFNVTPTTGDTFGTVANPAIFAPATAAQNNGGPSVVIDPPSGTATIGPAFTIGLETGSPALDKIPFGTNGCGTTVMVDERGVVRPQNTNCDIGAFELPATTLTIQIAGSGSGSVTSTSPNTAINCPSACFQGYSNGATVTLAESAAFGSAFAGWSGGSCSISGNVVTMNSPSETCVATFVPVLTTGASTQTSITSAISNPGTVNVPVTINFTVSSILPPPPVKVGIFSPAHPQAPVNGTVTVYSSDGNSCSAPLGAGPTTSGSCQITFTSPGVKDLTAVYSGNSAFQGSGSNPPFPLTINATVTSSGIPILDWKGFLALTTLLLAAGYFALKRR